MENNLLNGFNNGRDKSDGVGGNKPEYFDIKAIVSNQKNEMELILNKFANDFYIHLSPNKLMTSNDISKYITEWMSVNKQGK